MCLSAARLVGGGSLKSSNFFGFVHLLNYFRVYYDMLSTFNKSAFWDYMGKILSKYIEVRFCFDGFVEGNSMVQSYFNFDAQGVKLWFFKI